MAYSRPSASAANLTWAGAVAYTRPAASAANFDPEVGAVSPIAPTTQFGTPTGRMNYFLDATGFMPTTFGLGHVVPGQHVQLTEFARFGVASVPLLATSLGVVTGIGSPTSGPAYWGVRPIEPATTFGTAHVVAGQVVGSISLTTFGTASTIGGYWQHRASPPSTRFSMAYTAFAQTATPVGWLATKFGVPGKYVSTSYPVNRYGQAFGFESTTFGTPYAAFKQIAVASGTAPAFYAGTPSAIRGGHATGFVGGAFGTPSTTVTAHASGFRSTTIGTATAKFRCNANALAVSTAFGTPKRFVIDHHVYGINSSNKFGHPTGWTRINRRATGFTSTHLGSPASKDTHRALHIAPTAQMGTHLLSRTT